MNILDSKIDLFNKQGPLWETLRQWTVICLCIWLMVLFTLATYRLYKTHRHFTFDCVILSIESIKVSFF